MSGQIFISYRREESRWSARSLCDRLCTHFDRKQIFMDIDTIALGDDFVKTIEKTVGECDVLIAIIGSRWLTSKNEQDSRRLDDPEDFVRREIATALKRDIRVIPVMVDGASMPRASELPDDLKLLVRRNALQVTDTGFDDDCRRLVAAIEQVLQKIAAENREREGKDRLDAQDHEGLETGPRTAKTEEHFEPFRQLKQELHRHQPGAQPPRKRKLRWAGIIILSALSVGLAVVAVVYLVFRPPERKAITQPVAKTTEPVAAVDPAMQPSYPFRVRGSANIADLPMSFESGKLIVEFQAGQSPAGAGLKPGQGSWLDRGLRPGEPTRLVQQTSEDRANQIIATLRNPGAYWTFDCFNTNQGYFYVTASEQ
jgi:TIR domain